MNIAYNMDCVEGMRSLADESIDLTVTSPPYDNIRDYNGYIFDWHKTIEQLFRVTTRGGGGRLDSKRSDRQRQRERNIIQAGVVRYGMRF